MTAIRKHLHTIVDAINGVPHGVRTIVGLCVLMRVMQIVVAAAPVRTVLMSGDANYLLVPDVLSFLFAIHGTGLSLGFFWTPVTYMFLHGSGSHLLLNLVGLLAFGSAVETVVGRRTMWLVFIFSGIVGGMGWALSNGLGSAQPCLGASAGVLGLAGAYAALRPLDKFFVYVPFPITLPAWALATLIFILNAAELMFVQSQVAYMAHLVGIVAGIASGLVLRRVLRLRKRKS